MMTKRINIILDNQSGAALVIALIMMIVLTLIGLASTFSSTFESKLSGNKRESTGAFYTADAGLEAVKTDMTNFDTTLGYVAATGIPANLSEEAIDLMRTATGLTPPNLNLPAGPNFVVPPTVNIYHLRVGGEGIRSFRSDRYIIDSTGRDQLTGLVLFGSSSEIREKRLLRSLGPLSEMEN
jgi:Tfp pilus assembly protein PilX